MDEKLHELAERSIYREEKEHIERKKQIKLISKFKNNRNYGIVLIVTGAGFFVIGAIFAIIHANNYLRHFYIMVLFLGFILIFLGKSRL